MNPRLGCRGFLFYESDEGIRHDAGGEEGERKTMNLTEIFGAFAGREVAMKEEKLKLKIRGREMEFDQVELADANDPVLAEISQAAAKSGLSLRVFWPGIMGTADYQPSRLNIGIQKEEDGKWRISPDFRLG